MVRDSIEKIKDILTEDMVHVRASAMMPYVEMEEEERITLLRETHATDDLLEMAWREIKHKLDIVVEEHNGHAPPGYGPKSKHIDFYVMHGKDFPKFMKAIKEVVAEVLRNEK